VLKQHEMCPRCGLFLETDSSFWGDFTPYHEECDFETPCGGGNLMNDGVLGLNYIAHKGNIMFEEESDSRRFEARVRKAAARAQKARFEHGETPDLSPRLVEETEVSPARLVSTSFEDLVKQAEEVLNTESSPVVQRYRLQKLALSAGLRSEHHLDSLVEASLRLNDGKRGANAFG